MTDSITKNTVRAVIRERNQLRADLERLRAELAETKRAYQNAIALAERHMNEKHAVQAALKMERRISCIATLEIVQKDKALAKARDIGRLILSYYGPLVSNTTAPLYEQLRAWLAATSEQYVQPHPMR